MFKSHSVQLITYARSLLLALAIVATLACALDTNQLVTYWPLSAISPKPTPTKVQYTVKPVLASPGLAELESYRANLVVEFEGTRNGQPAGGRIESLTEVTQQPATLHQYFNSEMITPTTEIVNGISEYFVTEGKLYAKKAGEDVWLTLYEPQGADDQVLAAYGLGTLEPDQLIILPPAVSSPPQPESLNGLDVQHYTFTEEDLHDTNISVDQAQGDLWVASHGNLLIQYVISASLSITTPIPKAHILDRGQLTLHYALTDINRDFTIFPPRTNAIISNNRLGYLPRLPDAEFIAVFPTLIEYTSAISAISATLFYRDELTSREWTENKAEIFNEKTRLTYSREDKRLTVIITPADDRRNIKIVLDLKN